MGWPGKGRWHTVSPLTFHLRPAWPVGRTAAQMILCRASARGGCTGEVGPDVVRNRRLEGALQGTPSSRLLEAGRVAVEVRAPAHRAARRVGAHRTIGTAYEPDQAALAGLPTTADARSHRFTSGLWRHRSRPA